MQVGAVLMLEGELDARDLTAALAARVRTVPRLRQRLVRTPPGCGRPIWIDDPAFDIGDHVTALDCPPPGDEDALLAVAAEVVGSRLPADRPLWHLCLVSGLEAGASALVIAFHHVLADGIGGLAVLANLVDGAARVPAAAFPRVAPSNRALALDAIRSRFAALAGLRTSLGRLRGAFAQLGPAATVRAARSSLNQPTGARRSLAVARVDLDGVVRAAHAQQVTVNDVVLTAVAAALRTVLCARGESVDRFVVSIPVSARQQTGGNALGNQVGAIPLQIPATGDLAGRLRAVTEATRAAKRTPKASSTAILGPFFRLLARLGLFRWFIDRQRIVHTFVTNLRGPDSRLRFLGHPVSDVIAIAMITGNITVSFAVLSYAGTLGVTVIADPDAFPELHMLRDELRRELVDVVELPGMTPGRGVDRG